jgi:hypothetical protein
MWPTMVCASRIIRFVTSAEVINSPTSRKNGTASKISESMPWNICPIIDCMLIGVRAHAASTPAINAKATGTPI